LNGHLEWLGTDPNTKGENKTWNLWFSPDGPAKANNFETHWAKYLLKGDAYTTQISQTQAEASDGSVKTEVETRSTANLQGSRRPAQCCQNLN